MLAPNVDTSAPTFEPSSAAIDGVVCYRQARNKYWPHGNAGRSNQTEQKSQFQFRNDRVRFVTANVGRSAVVPP